MITDSSLASLATESCLLHDQSGYPREGQENADGLPAEESFRASLEMDAMAASLDATVEAASGIASPSIHRAIQCRGATPMSRGKSNIDTIVIHTPEGHVPGTLSVLSGTRAGFDWYLPPSGELYKCNDYLRHFSWHAGDLAYNRRSVGIEQWDFAANMTSAPDEHYQRLARLCAYLVETLDLAIRHAKNYGEFGFISHGTITPQSRWDPGKFDYDKLLSLVSDLVKGRPEPKLDPVDGDPPNGEPLNGGPQKKIWLPGLDRVAAGAFDENHLDAASVMTLDGNERAVIVPKGVAMRVPKPGEPTEKPERPDDPEKLKEPDDPNGLAPTNPEAKRLASVIDGYFASLPSTLGPYTPVGAAIVDEAKKANLHITSACALIEQESAGCNVFGADWGTRGAEQIPFAHLPVTKERAGKLISYVRSGGVSNGVGLTQLTWRDFIFDAENRGGAHLPKNQCAVGFELLSGYYGKYPYLEAIGAYNAGESNRRSVIHTYSAQFAQKHEAWRRRLGIELESTQPPQPNPSPNVNDPEPPENPPPANKLETPEKPPVGEKPPEATPHGEAPTETTPPKEEAPVTTPPEAAPPEAVPPEKPEPLPTTAPAAPTTPTKGEKKKDEKKKSPKLDKAAKAIVAAAVPVVGALLLWASTGTLDETEFSVGATGLLTALIVYFVPNSTDEGAKS